MPDTHIYSSATQLYNKIPPFVIRNTEIIITGSEMYIFLLSAISISYNMKISTPDKYLSRICFFNALGIPEHYRKYLPEYILFLQVPDDYLHIVDPF